MAFFNLPEAVKLMLNSDLLVEFGERILLISMRQNDISDAGYL